MVGWLLLNGLGRGLSSLSLRAAGWPFACISAAGDPFTGIRGAWEVVVILRIGTGKMKRKDLIEACCAFF